MNQQNGVVLFLVLESMFMKNPEQLDYLISENSQKIKVVSFLSHLKYNPELHPVLLLILLYETTPYKTKLQ